MSDRRLPAAVVRMAARGPDWADWVDTLPATRDALLTEWGLDPDGAPTHGFCSLVVPVRDHDRRPAILKIGFPDEESEHEHLALRHWGGRAAVTLLRADPRRRALLLERLHDRTLTTVGAVEACRIVAGLYRELHVPAPPQLRRLDEALRSWAERLAALPVTAAVPHRLVEQARWLDVELAADAARGRLALLHTDLHYDNVLASCHVAPRGSPANRPPWLVIDPKPLAGDPHYELAPMLWNRWDELTADVRGGVRRRFHALVETAELDPDRARDYVVVRMIHNAALRLADPPGTQRITPTDEYLTMCVAIAKAVQD